MTNSTDTTQYVVWLRWDGSDWAYCSDAELSPTLPSSLNPSSSLTWKSSRTISLNQSSTGYRILAANATSPITKTNVTFQQIHDIIPNQPMASSLGEERLSNGSTSWDNWSVVIGDDPTFKISRGAGGGAVRCELKYTEDKSWSYQLLDSSGAVKSKGPISNGGSVDWDAPASGALTLNVTNTTSSSTKLTVKETRTLGTKDSRTGVDGDDMYMAWTLGVPTTGTQVWTVSAADSNPSSVQLWISPPSTHSAHSAHSALTAPLAAGVRRTLRRLSARSKS